jgi:hypothetical protein
MVRNMFYLLLLNLTAFMSCSLIFNTVNVTVPKGYQGWCYVIPVKDTTGFAFQVSPDGEYKINDEGVIYVPAALMDSREDLRLKVYEDGKDITDDTRYMGRVTTSNTKNNQKYSYVRFLIPTNGERVIDASDDYWRKNNFRQNGIAEFDSLLKSNKIIFR